MIAKMVEMLLKVLHMFKIMRKQIFFLDNLNAINVVVVKKDIELTEITFDNVEHVTDFRSEEYAVAFGRCLEEGQYGIYAWIDSKVVGHALASVCRKYHCLINGYMKIYRDEALIRVCNVKESQRGNNIYPAMLAALCQRLFSKAKVRRVLIDTEVDNKASLRGIAKVGFKPLGKGTYIQFLGKLIYKYEQLKPSIQREEGKH